MSAPSTPAPVSAAAPSLADAETPIGGWAGWSAIVSASLFMAATLPGRTHGLGLITKRLLEDFSTVSQTDFAQMNLWATLLGSLACLPGGWALDRWGARRVGSLVLLALAGLIVAMANVQTVPQLVVALILVRTLGQSLLSVTSLAIIGKAFPGRPGKAMGAYAVVMTMLMAIATGMLGDHITLTGWRYAWWELGLSLFVVLPLAWWLTPRGRSQTASAPVAAALKPSSLTSATWLQALATPCFWVFALGISLLGLVSTGFSLFQQFIFEEQGLAESVYHRGLILGFVVGMAANLGAGWLALRWPLERLLAGGLTIFAAALAVMPLVSTPGQSYAFAVFYGLGGGVITVLFFTVWGQAFGTAQLARIQGAAQMLTVLASAVGPLVISQGRVMAGSYGPVLWALAGVSLVLALASLTVRVPSAVRGDWLPEESAELRLQESTA